MKATKTMFRIDIITKAVEMTTAMLPANFAKKKKASVCPALSSLPFLN